MKLYRIHNVYCPLDHDERYLRERAAKELGVRPGHLAAFGIERRSIDARDKRAVRFVYTLTAGLESPSRSLGAKAAELAPAEPYRFPAPSAEPSGKEGHRPIIVGAGPAGLFCALMLAEAGYPAPFIRAVESHGWGLCSDVEPVLEMEKVLYAVDELTGFIAACAYVRPSRSVLDLEVKSVKKKWKTVAFAAGVNRDVIEKGAAMLGLELDSLIEETIVALRGSAEAVGLKGAL